jgi:hypothetical protein
MTLATAGRAQRRASAVVVASAAVALAVLVALSGCVPIELDRHPTPTGRATPFSVAPAAPLVVPAVLEYCPLESAVHFDGYLLPVDEVFICRADGSHGSDGVSTFGPWESASSVAHAAALLAAYRVADARTTDARCIRSFHDPLIVWVHHNGVTTAYYAPVDRCGYPSAAATSAYEKARRTVLIDVDRGAPDAQHPLPSTKDATG